MKQKPVVIRTPVPTLEEFRRAIGMSKARAKRIREIMDGSRKKPFQVMESKSKRRVVMTYANLIEAVDTQIAQLQAVKSILAGGKKPGGSTRVLSADARQRISDAQKRRWAKQKRAKKAA